MTTQPMSTAMEVVKIIMNSLFSRRMVATSAAESEEALEGSILPLINADIRSSGETFIKPEEDDGSICFVKSEGL